MGNGKQSAGSGAPSKATTAGRSKSGSGKTPAKLTLAEAVEKYSRSYVLRALNRNKWSKVKTAAQLGISREWLWKLIQKWEIE